ncbi:MAG: hypothetical protein Q8K75_00005 [Chlamydiales bacterium]|nr:hypothetical protein [Chlamydiales bacterium]
MLSKQFSHILLCLVFLLGGVQPLPAVDWTGWYSGGKSLVDSEFWDPAQSKIITSDVKAQTQLIENISNDDHIMRVTGQGRNLQLTIHNVYTYSPSDFKVYKQKVPDYAEEQTRLGNWINQIVRENPHNQHITSTVDRFFKRLVTDAKGEQWAEELQQELLAARLGIGPKVFVEHPDFEEFVQNNFLFKHIPYHKHKVVVDSNGIPQLLVEETLTPWTSIKDIAHLDHKGRLQNYYYTYRGLVPGKPEEQLLVFKQVPPNTYHHQYILEVVSIRRLPPHNWVRMIDPEGNVYSIGFWGVTPMTDLWSAIKHIVPESGKVTSPDLMEIVGDPLQMISTPIKITEEQFKDLLNFIENYQNDPGKYEVLGWLGGENCAVFVKNVMDHLGFKIKASSWTRPFDNPYDIMDWQHAVADWRYEQIDKLQNSTPEERWEIEYSLPKSL